MNPSSERPVSVFTNAAAGSVFGVTKEGLFTGKLPPKEQRDELVAALEQGRDPQEAVKNCQKLSWDEISSVQVSENRSHDIAVAGTGLFSSMQMKAKDAEDRTRFLDAVRSHLTPAVQETRSKSNLFAAIQYPMYLTLLAIAFTVGGVGIGLQMAEGTHQQTEHRGRHAAKKHLIEMLAGELGPAGMLLIGVPVILGCGYWTYRKAAGRHEVVTLKPDRPQS